MGNNFSKYCWGWECEIEKKNKLMNMVIFIWGIREYCEI